MPDTGVPSKPKWRGRFLHMGRLAWILLLLVPTALVLLGLVTVQPLFDTAARNPHNVSVIGDSYMGGSAMGGTGPKNVTVSLRSRFEWKDVNDVAVGGTGYVAAQPWAAPFETAQLARALATDPDLLLIVGSRNDAGKVGVFDAATHLYNQIRSMSPGTRTVVIGPLWGRGLPPRQVLQVRDQVAAAARSAGLPFIDPISEGWFAGNEQTLIGPDGVHPDDAGHQYMAQRIGDDLIRLRLTKA